MAELAELKIGGRTLDGNSTMGEFKSAFKDAFGYYLRVYKNEDCKGRMVDNAATIASVSQQSCFKSVDERETFSVEGAMPVYSFVNRVWQYWRIGVKVANAGDTYLVDEFLTLDATVKK